MNKTSKISLITASIIFIILLVFIIPLINSDTSKQNNKSNISNDCFPTYDKTCKNGKCNLVVYSNIQNVYEDEKCKKIWEARSLNGSGINCVVESDGIHEAECLDWNYTSITLKLKVNDSKELGKDIPIKFLKTDDSGNKIENVSKKKSVKFNSKTEEKEILLNYEFGEEIHFGENSTILFLQAQVTENTGDSWIEEANPDTTHSPSASLEFINDSGNNKHGLIKWNIGSIPNGSTIVNATLGLYYASEAMSAASDEFRLEVHRLYSTYSFSQGTVTWNNGYPNGTSFNQTYESSYWVPSTLSEGYKLLQVKDAVQAEVGTSQVQFFLASAGSTGNPSSSEYARFSASENTGTAEDPFLNITYNVPEPIFSNLIPTNNTNQSSNTIQFNCTATMIGSGSTNANITDLEIWYGNYSGFTSEDATGIYSQIFNSTTIPPQNHTQKINWTDTLVEGVWYWYCVAGEVIYETGESASFLASNESRFIVDSAYPTISYGTGTSVNFANLSQNSIYINTTWNETNLANITFSLYNSTWNNQTTYTTLTRFINFTNIANGRYWYYVNITDLVNNKNYTSIYNITLDNTNPNATLIFPNNGTYNSTTSQNFTVNLTDNLGIKNATLYIYNNSGIYNVTNTNFVVSTTQSLLGIVVVLVDNVYNWFYKVFDWSGNSFTSQNRTITIDTVNPQINLTYPLNTTYTTVPTGINFTRSDTNLQSCWYSTDGGTTNTTISNCNNVTGLTASQGSNTWLVGVNDSANNKNMSIVTFFVDSIIPTINFTSPTETSGNYLNRNNILVNVTSTDTNLKNITIYLYNSDKSLNRSNTTLTSPNYINYTNMADGTYLFNATATDLLNNKNSTEIRTITIDTTKPLISYGTGVAVNYANLSQSNIYVNVSYTETNFANITFSLYNSSWSNITTYNSPTSNGLTIHMPFDVDARDTSGNNYDGTVTQAMFNSTGGIKNGSYYFNGSSRIEMTPVPDELQSGNFSISVWFKLNETGVLGTDYAHIIYRLGNMSSNNDIDLSVRNETNASGYNIGKHIFFEIYNDTSWESVYWINDSLITTNAWHHLAVTLNDGVNMSIYFDGVFRASNRPSNKRGTSYKSSYSYIGGRFVGETITGMLPKNFTGDIDEFRFYNTVLSDSEISNLYNEVASSRAVNFTSLGDGKYWYFVNITDLANNKNSTSVYNITLDSINPNATLIFPTNNTFNITTSQNFTTNLTDNLGIKNATLYIYNNSGIYNVTNTNFVPSTVQSLLGIVVILVDNVYNWWVSVWDWAGNSYTTGNRTITIDTINPAISITYPTNNSNTTNTQLNVNYTRSDTNLGSCWYTRNLGVTNTSLGTACTNITGVTWLEGLNNITIYVNDSANNINSSSITFRLDTTIPSINITYPINNSVFRDQYSYNISLNVTSSDSGVGVQAWKYSLNGATNTTFTPNTTVIGLRAGRNNLTVYVNDTLGNTNSSTITFNLTFTPKINNINVSNSSVSYDRNSLTDGLVGWWKLDENNSIQIDSSGNGNNGTVTGGSNVSLILNGKIGGAYNFKGINSYIDLGNTASLKNLTGNQTICMWLYPINISFNRTNPYEKSYGGEGTITLEKSGSLNYYYGTGGTDTSPYVSGGSTTTIKENVWSHICVTRAFNVSYPSVNGTIIWYINGAFDKQTNTSLSWANSSTKSAKIGKGYASTAPYGFNGTIDEVRIYNRSLSASEISQLYQITNPTFQEYGNITINNTITDEDTPQSSLWYEYFVDGVSVLTGFAQNIFNYIFTRQSSIVQLNVNDSSGYFVNQTWNISTTFINPTINFTNPTPGNNTNQSSSTIIINITGTEANLNLAWAEVNKVNYTMSCTGGNQTSPTYYCNRTFSSLADGLYNFTAYINDSVNNRNNTETRSRIRVDTTPPVTAASATPYTFNTWTKNDVDVTFITTDFNGVGVDTNAYPKYCNDSTNTCFPTIFNIDGVTISQEGTSYVRYYANDTINNNETVKSQTIKIDKTNPAVSIIYPTSYLNFSSNTSISLNFTRNDSLSGIGSCWYTLNSGVTNTTISNCANTTFNSSEGLKTLILYVNDTVNNINSTNVTFTIDLTNPTINFTNPTETNNSYLSRNNIIVNVTATDTNLKNITIYLYNSDRTLNRSNTTTTSPNYINYSNLAYGIYYINSTAYDFSNNKNSTETRTITLDNTLPLISYGTRTAVNFANLSQNSIYINLSITETNFANITYSLYNSSWNNITTYTTLTRFINFTNIANGRYWYFVNITDLANNKNSTAIYNITLDTNNPNATLIFPTNNTYNSTTSQNFTTNLTDNLGIKNATLYIYNNSGIYNVTNTNFVPSTVQSFLGIVVTLVDNVYNWWVSVWDWAGNSFTTGNRTVTIDTVNPAINFTSLTETSGTFVDRNYLLANVTATDTNLKNITIYLYNSTNLVNSTNSTSSPLYFNFTNLVDNIYYINVTSHDYAGNKNSTETRTITIDTTNPLINYSTDSELDRNNVSRDNIYINVTVIEPNPVNITFLLYNTTSEVNTTTYSMPSQTVNTSINFTGLPDELYYYNVTITDQVNRANTTITRTIRIDTSNPQINITSPENITYRDVYTYNYSLSLTYSDTGSGIKNYTYFINNGNNISFNPNITISGLNIGSNNVTITATDYAGNKNITSRTFYLAFTPKINNINISNSSTSYSRNGLNDGLVGYWKLDENNTNQTDSSSNLNHGTVSGASFTENGMIGGGYSFDGNDKITINNLASYSYFNKTNPYSISAWVNSIKMPSASSSNLNPTIIEKWDASGAFPFVMRYTNSSGKVTCGIYNGTSSAFATSTNDLTQKDSLITCVYNTTDVVIYVNGEYNSKSSYSTLSGDVVNTKSIWLGSRGGTQEFFNGTIDEVRIYNRSLSATEISQLYSITNPTFQEYGNITINNTITDEDTPQASLWYEFFVDGVSVLSGFAQNVFNWIFTGRSQIVQLNVNDSQGYYVNQTWNITTTFINPTINFTNPTPSNNTYQTSTTITINITGTETNVNDSWVAVNSTTNYTMSCTNVSSTFYCNRTLVLPDAQYNLTGYIRDKVGNINNTEVRRVTVDATYPLISYGTNNPVNFANLSQSNVYINLSITETNFANITYSLYNSTWNNQTTYSTLTRFINFTNIPNGRYWYFVNITDLANNKNSTAIYNITLDNTNPNATLIFPTNGTYNSTTSQNFTTNLTDNLGIKNATLYIYNNSGIYNVTNTNFVVSTTQSLLGIVVTLVDNVYNWWVSVWDWSGNTYTTQNNTLTIDTVNPQINLTYPLNTTYTTIPTYINYTRSDTNLNTCWYSTNNGATNTTASSCNNVTGLSANQGSNTWLVGVNDSANNKNMSIVTFFVDSIIPTINFTNPTENTGTYQSRNNIQVNVTSTDTNLKNITIYLFNSDKTINQTNASVTSPNFINYTNLADGLYFFNATSRDGLNQNSTETRNVTIDVTNPLTSYGTGTAVNFANLSQSNVYINLSTTETNFANITFNLYNSTWNNITTYTTLTRLINFTNIANGRYWYFVNITDLANNKNSTAIYNITLDNQNPNATLIFPANNTFNSTASQNFTVNLTDNLGIKNATLYIYNNSNSWLDFDGIDDNIDIANSDSINFSRVGEITVGVWVKIANITKRQFIIGKHNGGVNGVFFLEAYNGSLNDLRFVIINSTGSQLTAYNRTAHNIYDNNWHYIVVIASNNTKTMQIYYDNILINNNTQLSLDFIKEYNTPLRIGSFDGASLLTNGSIDEVRIYNRSISSSEISEIYNSGLNSNSSLNSTGLVSWYDFQDKRGSILSDKVGNNNGTISGATWSYQNMTSTSFSPNIVETTLGIVITLTDGVYNWFYDAWDWANNFFRSETNVITIDSTNTQISYNPSTTTNGTWRQTGDIFINITASDTNKDTVQFEWNGVNETFANSGGDYYWENKTGLTTGNYTVYAWINDSAGSFNKTQTNSYYLDLENPTVTILYPEDLSTKNTNESLPLNFTATDTNLNSCWYNFDNGINNSIACTSGTDTGTTFNISEGSHTINVYANDSSGRVGSHSHSFQVNLAPPEIVVTYPTNNLWINYRNISINYTATDSDGISSSQLWGNWTGTWHKNQTHAPTSGVQDTFYVNLTDGSYIWNIWVNDTGNNAVWAFSSNYTLNVDSTNPLINFTNPTSSTGTNFSRNWIYVNISLTEINFQNITFTLRNDTGNVNVTTFTVLTTSINWTNLPDKNYTYFVNVTDKANNKNSTETRIIRLDTTSPAINITQPLNTTYRDLYSYNYSLNITSPDSGVGIISSYWYSLNNGGTNTTFTPNSTVTGLVAGSNTLKVWVNDTLNNVNSTNVTFYLAFTPKINNINISNSTTSYSRNDLTSLSEGLVGWWKLDENNTNQVDSSGYGNNGTVVNATFTNDGKIGGGYSSNESEQWINFGDKDSWSIDKTNNLSIGFWIYCLPNGLGYTHPLGKGSSGNYEWYFRTGQNCEYIAVITNNNSAVIDSSIQSTRNLTSRWTYITATWMYNGTTMNRTLYVNSGLITNNLLVVDYANDIADMRAFDRYDTRNFNGSIDEVRIYNRSLSATEISQLYSITNPTFQEYGNVTINNTITDEDTPQGSLYYSWFVDNVLQPISGLAQSVFNYIFTKTSTIVQLNVNDTSGYFVNQTWNISTTFINPTINFTNPTSVNGTYNTTNSITINFTGTESNLQTKIITLNNVNYTPTCTGGNTTNPIYYCNYTFSGLADNKYNFSAWINDSVGNTNQTETRMVTIDTTKPQISYGTGTQPNYANLSQNSIYINLSTTEINLENMSYTLYNSSNSLDYTDLVGYWNFDRNTSVVYDLSWNRNDGTNVNATWNASGKIGGAYDFDGVNEYIRINTITNINISGNITFGGWVKWYTQSGVNNGRYLSKQGDYYIEIIDGSGRVDCGILGLSDTYLTGTGTDISDGNWHQIFCSYNGTSKSLWQDGVLKISEPSTGDITTTGTYLDISGNTEGRPMNGSIDEVMIFNTSLSASEVSALYNRSLVNHTEYSTQTNQINFTNLNDGYYSYFADILDKAGNYNNTLLRNIFLDTNNPNATLLTPVNSSYNNTDQNFTANLTDNLGIKNATLHIYSGGTEVNNTFFSFISNTIQSTIGVVVTLADGIYTWFFDIYDFANNYYATQNNTVTIDKTLPGVNIIYPLNTTYTTIPGELNYTFSDINPNLCWYSTNGGITNTSLTCGNNVTISASQGSNTWLIRTQDLANNINSSYVTFFVDSIIPTINFTNPTEISGIYLNRNNIIVNVTSTDTNLKNITIYLFNSDKTINQTNASLTSPNYINYTNLADGLYFFNATSRDGLNLNSTETRNVTIDVTLPSTSITYPSTGDYILTQSFNALFSISDTNIDSCWYSTNQTSNISISNCSATSLSLNLPDNPYTLTFYANDSANNINSSSVNFIIDSTSPVINFISPTQDDNKNVSASYITVNTSYTEANFASVTFKLTNETDTINSTLFSTNISEITFYNVANGHYNYSVIVNDLAGNSATLIRQINLDDTAPVINIVEPQNINYGTNTSLSLNFTVTDNLLGVKTCRYYVLNSSSDIIITNTNLPNCQNTTFSLPSGDISYDLYLLASDFIPNTATSIRPFMIRTESPAVVLYPVNDTQVNYLNNHLFNFTVSTNANSITNCSLYGNFNGTWLLNQTKTSGITYDGSTKNSFNRINLTEGDFLWNTYCCDDFNHCGWGLNNLTFVTDLTYPIVNITSISTTAGSQTVTLIPNSSDLHTTTCKYSVYNSSNGFDGCPTNCLENKTFTCNTDTAITVSGYKTFNLTIYTKDKAGNENSSTKSFTTSASSGGITGGAGAGTTVIYRGEAQSILASNFSINPSVMDIILAKDSTKSRERSFRIINRYRYPIKVSLVCDTSESNESSNNINICDYVKFRNSTLILSPNEDQPTTGYFEVYTPINGSISDVYYANILALYSSGNNESVYYSKMSVTFRITTLSTLFYKYSDIPGQSEKPVDQRIKYPTLGLSLALAFIIFLIIFFIFYKLGYTITGLITGFISFFISWYLLALYI